MSTYGRRNVPGEKPLGGVLNKTSVLNRTLRAQVTAVNAENGYVIATYESMPSGGKYMTVPPLWMSFPEVGGPAWGRYMPQQSDRIKVSFDYDDNPYVMGYDVLAGKETIADGFGWPQLNEQYVNGKKPDTPTDRAKFAQFVPLNPGEYDFMSSGGAYIYGNNRGRLYLAGGTVSISLIKNDLRITQRAQLHQYISDDCELRFGQARRPGADNLELPTGVGKFKEFTISLKNTEDPGTSTNLSALRIGNVSSLATGAEDKSPTAGQGMRFSYKAYTEAGEEALHMAIDKIGNWDMIAPTASTGVTFDFSSSDWRTYFESTRHESYIDYTVVSPKVSFEASDHFSVDSPAIFLGAAGATHPLFLTNTYGPAEATFANDLAQDVFDLATQVVALTAIVNAMGIALIGAAIPLLIPVVGPMVASPIFAASGIATTLATGAVTAGAGTAGANAQLDANIFTGPGGLKYQTDYFSNTSKTK